MDRLFAALMFSLVIGVGAAVAVAAATVRTQRGNWRNAMLTGIIAFVVVFGGLAARDSMTQVEAGSVAVVKQFGKVVDVFDPGLHWKLPFIQETVVYRTQEIVYETSANPAQSQADYTDYEVDTATSDGQQISARYTVRFRIDPAKAAWIVNNLGTESEMVEKVVKANSRVWVRNILKQYPASDLYSGNVELAQQAIAERLAGDFTKEGLELVFFGLRSIQFTEAYKNAVENKQIEAENIITKQNLAKQAEYEKQRTITQAQAEAERQKLERIGVAEGEAEAIKLKAQAEAEATRIRAQAQAEANRLIAASLTPEVIRWQAVQVWNGNYPLVMGQGQYILPGDLFTSAQPSTQP